MLQKHTLEWYILLSFRLHYTVRVDKAHSPNPLLLSMSFVVCLFKNKHLKKTPNFNTIKLLSTIVFHESFFCWLKNANCCKSQRVPTVEWVAID